MGKLQTNVDVVEVKASDSSRQTESEGSFFPWDPSEKVQLPPKNTSAFPKIGFVALAGSVITIFLSFAVLRSIDGHQVFQSKYIKPAAWLSIILSANSILLHTAMQEGINISWWFQAQKEQATAEQLHDTWDMGTSIISAIRAGRKFNYIALATIFISTVPLNGLLLQNAITPVPTVRNTTGSVSIPMLQEFPLGFSANINQADGSIGVPNYEFASAASAWFNLNGYNSPWSVPFPPTQWNLNCNGTDSSCYANATGVGFQPTCSNYSIPYNLEPATNDSVISARILDSSISWNASLPNQMKVNLLWKDPAGQCNGTYHVYNCTLQAASIRYPVVITSFSSANPNALPQLSLQPQSTYQDDEFVSFLPVQAGEGITNTTYGGIAPALASYFNGSMDVRFSNGTWSSQQSGFLPTALYPYQPSNEYCSLTFGGLAFNPSTQDADLSTTLFESLRHLMFMSSTLGLLDQYRGLAANPPPPQSLPAIQSDRINKYQILWRYWWASAAVTLTIVLFILPTFYGYWRLARRTTLSPFETARAFNAPIIGQADMHTPTPELLKRIGNKNVHKDLVLPNEASTSADL